MFSCDEQAISNVVSFCLNFCVVIIFHFVLLNHTFRSHFILKFSVELLQVFLRLVVVGGELKRKRDHWFFFSTLQFC